jgi:amylosucrase
MVENDPSSPHSRIFTELVWLTSLCKQQSAIYGNETEFVETGNGHLFGYIRHGSGQRLLRLEPYQCMWLLARSAVS